MGPTIPFTPEERFEYLIQNLRVLGSEHTSVEPAIAVLVEEVNLYREAQGGDPKRLAEFYATQNEQILEMLTDINSALLTVEQHMPPDLDRGMLLKQR